LGRKRFAKRSEPIPYWPPGPGDEKAWTDIIERCPELAPAVENSNNNGHGDKPRPGKPESNQRQPGERGIEPGSDESLGDSCGASPERKSNFHRKMEAREAELWEGTSNPGGRTDQGPTQAEAESPICGMVDGQTSILELANANRTERLQALGNGVVPTTGAIALRVLFERLVGVDYGC